MRVEIWSDVVCPWCYIGKRRFESALARFAHRDDVEVRWRSFELDPTSPGDDGEPVLEHLAAKYGVSVEQAKAMQDRMTEHAAGEGLTLDFSATRRANTVDAHRLLHLAAEHGVQDAVKERFLRAYFTDGAAIGDHATLATLAVDAGLDEADVEEVLASDRYLEAVRDDQLRARRYGISGVPFFVVDEKYGVSGAQPSDVFTELLKKAWSESRPLQVVAAGQDVSCDDDSCCP